jgi:ribosome recycling factor
LRKETWMTELLIKDANDRMSKTRSILEKELSSVRTGRASSSLVENLNVDYFGTPTPLIHLASITVPEARLIVIQPFDRNSIPAIEKSILQSDIGISPAVDGEVIRLPIPSLTQERRKQIAKTVRSKTEAEKISVRNIRRDILDQMKKNLKKKELSEDDAKRASDQIQKITDQYVNEIESIGSAKEAEVMEV